MSSSTRRTSGRLHLSAGGNGSADLTINQGKSESPTSPQPVSEGHSNSLSVASASTPLSPYRQNFAVVPPRLERPWEYRIYEDDIIIDEILEEIIGQYEVKYLVKLRDSREITVSDDDSEYLHNTRQPVSHCCNRFLSLN